MMRKLGIVMVLLAASGCTTSRDIGTAPSVQRAAGDVLPPPAGIGADGRYVYHLGALDTISIEVDGLPDMRREVVIDGQGMIAYPLAGSVSAEGLTSTQLAALLEERLRASHVREPRVSVNIVTPQSNFLTVDGEVNKPGLFPVYRDMTLMQAVALAGSDTDVAQSSRVLIFREVSGQQYVGLYDLKAIRFGNYADPKVYPADKIVVSESETLRLLQSLQGVTGIITTPLVLLLR